MDRKTFYTENLWGMSTSVDLYDCNPSIIRDAEKIKEYVKQLCDLIEMKTFGECLVVHFGEDPKVSGFSMTQLIETSLISGHFANFELMAMCLEKNGLNLCAVYRPLNNIFIN